MTTHELEQQLEELGARLALPPAPNVVPGALARLPARPRRRYPAKRTLAVALGVLLLLAAGVMAAPPSREVILRILGLRGVRIERVPHLPPRRVGAGLGLGQRIPLNHARRAATFAALLPPGSAVAYLGHDVAGGRVSLLVGRVLILEFRGRSLPFIFKTIGPGTRVKQLQINGNPGVYLSGAPHQVLFESQTGAIEADRVRVAGNVLIWQHRSVTIRIEGTRTLGQALAVARSLR
jgi:hypothetical protein